jgi:hypothetical protein
LKREASITDKVIEAKHLLPDSGYSLASCSSAVLPLLHRRGHFIRSIYTGQSTEKQKVHNLFLTGFCTELSDHPKFLLGVAVILGNVQSEHGQNGELAQSRGLLFG